MLWRTATRMEIRHGHQVKDGDKDEGEESWSKEGKKGREAKHVVGGGAYLRSFCCFHTKYLRVRVASVYWVNITTHILGH